MSRSKTVYTVERAKRDADGGRYRIFTQVEGPYADLRDTGPKHVAHITEEQARRLRDDLDDVLDS